MSVTNLLRGHMRDCKFVFAERKDVGRCEELVLNAVATINNLSYYFSDHSSIVQRRLHVAECTFLFSW